MKEYNILFVFTAVAQKETNHAEAGHSDNRNAGNKTIRTAIGFKETCFKSLPIFYIF